MIISWSIASNKMLCANEHAFIHLFHTQLHFWTATSPNPMLTLLQLRLGFREVYKSYTRHKRSVCVPTVTIACRITALFNINHDFLQNFLLKACNVTDSGAVSIDVCTNATALLSDFRLLSVTGSCVEELKIAQPRSAIKTETQSSSH